MKKNLFSKILFFSTLALFFVFEAILAEESTGFFTIPNPLTGINSLPDLLQRVADFIRNLALILMPLFITWGGLKIITAGGNAESVKKGREIIVWTIIGVIMALVASVIAGVIGELFPAPAEAGRYSYLLFISSVI
ncbi:MAG: pilin [Candidatus Paceibacterota bacterium]